MDPTGGRRVFLFDEPTSGLHPQDIQKLLVALRGLLAIGHAVVVVEHQLDFIASCDWIVDLGPGGGAEGGRLLYSGLLEGIVDVPDSITGRLLDSTLSDPQPTSSCPSPRGSPSRGV